MRWYIYIYGTSLRHSQERRVSEAVRSLGHRTMLRAAVVLTTLLLASLCSAQTSNAPITCADDPCQNGGQCEDGANSFICHCTLEYIGDRCQFQASIINTTVCLVSSKSLDNDSLCANAVDGSDANGLSTEWVIDGSYGAIGAFIALHLVNSYNVIGIKYLQRCDPQDQFKTAIATLNDGTMEFSNATCYASANTCNENRWETLYYDSARSGIYLLKMTVLELCTSNIHSPVGLRDIVVLATNDECTNSNPCLNGGTCNELDIGYECDCSGTGFQGDNCEINIDDCVGVVCQNGGSCVDQVNGYQCLCADGTEGTLCTDPEDLECTCSLNGTTLALDVFDEPDLMVYSTGQKTILSSYKLTENDPCKFKFLSVTSGNTVPAPLTAIIFNIGKHPKKAKKFYRSYRITQTSIKERGVGKKHAKELTLPHCWTGPNQETDICIERVGNVIQFRSTKCPYALDVDVGSTPLSGTLYIEKSVNWPLMGMCGDCDDQFNGYVLADGTSVDNVPDEQERFRLITKSYLSSKARRR